MSISYIEAEFICDECGEHLWTEVDSAAESTVLIAADNALDASSVGAPWKDGEHLCTDCLAQHHEEDD